MMQIDSASYDLAVLRSEGKVVQSGSRPICSPPATCKLYGVKNSIASLKAYLQKLLVGFFIKIVVIIIIGLGIALFVLRLNFSFCILSRLFNRLHLIRSRGRSSDELTMVLVFQRLSSASKYHSSSVAWLLPPRSPGASSCTLPSLLHPPVN